MFRDTPLTKRQLGWLFVLLAAGLALVALSADLIGAGQFDGLGPAQQQALIVAGVLLAIGLSLLPLGSRPA